MSVRPSVRVERRDSHSTDYYEIFYLLFLLKFIGIFQFLLKQGKITGTLYEGLRTIM